jgi:hypothetical protein
VGSVSTQFKKFSIVTVGKLNLSMGFLSFAGKMLQSKFDGKFYREIK